MDDPDATTQTLIAACDLHRDDLLAGFGLRDSVDFDDWQRLTQDSLRRERAATLDRLIGRLEREGRLDDAVARARERLDLDRLHEPTHRALDRAVRRLPAGAATRSRSTATAFAC